MSADKRAVHTDALATLGTIIGDGEKRDAIHLAVEPVIAGELLYPGDDVGIIDGVAYDRDDVKKIGIVDPFIQGRVNKGDRFWLVVYPRQITSLRHVWTHPDLPESPEDASSRTPETPEEERRKASELWLRRFASREGFGYDTLLAAVAGEGEHGNDGVELWINGEDAQGLIPDELWDHASIVLGREIPSSQRAKYLSCSC